MNRAVGSRSHTGGTLRPKQGSALGRWTPAVGAALVLTAVVFVGFSGENGTTNPGVGGNPGSVDPAGLTVEVNQGPLVETNGIAGPKTTLTATLGKGSSGEEVRALQDRLKALGFDPGPSDGDFGNGTQQAVWAFEAIVYNLPYDQQVGVVTNEMWQRMQDPLVFNPRRQEPDDTHMEIYLPVQAAIVFTNDKPALITHISSGSGVEWCEVFTQDTDDLGIKIDPPILKDECGVSVTPGGIFLFYRRYPGNRLGPLGGMWNPVYFNYGIAVHGADQVPNRPASHGCIRIPQWIADYFPQLVAKNDRVYVWGMDGKEPEDYTKDEMLPVFNYPNRHSTLTLEPTTTSTTVKATTTTKAPTTTVAPTTSTEPTPPASG
ncbi:MAG: L,D-transpeptidase family protein [Actinomycetota bacterium]|nr:L,D-transpeptidase family protein [Actinomycetota bacterium]